MTYRMVLLRHGQSTWNLENLFTGWTDVGLTEQGEAEARAAGQVMIAEGLEPDILHTSVLERAIKTAELTLEEMGLEYLPVRRSWRLNERHYGALQGLDKKETAAEHGDEQVLLWRRSYDIPPPPLDPDDERHPRHDPRYANLPPDLLPATECLADVVVRMLPYWHDVIVDDLRSGRTPLVVAHGNSIRALVKHLDGVSEEEIVELNIPTGVPLALRAGPGHGPGVQPLPWGSGRDRRRRRRGGPSGGIGEASRHCYNSRSRPGLAGPSTLERAMAFFEAIAIVIHIILSLALVALVLLHSGKGGGLSDVFGGGMSTTSLGGSTVVERNLDRLTVLVGVLFGVSTFTLTFILS